MKMIATAVSGMMRAEERTTFASSENVYTSAYGFAEARVE